MHDMLRIMDVASALRRERETAEAQLDVATAKARLRERLLATAAAAGETVTPAEVDAAIAHYFAEQHRYADPPPGLKNFLLHCWVQRGGCLFLLVFVGLLSWGVLALLDGFGGGAAKPVVAPPVRSEPVQKPATPPPSPPVQNVTPTPAVVAPVVTPTPPPPPVEDLATVWAAFEAEAAAARAIAADDVAIASVEQVQKRGAMLFRSGNLERLRASRSELREVATRLFEEYTVTIIDRRDEVTGFERLAGDRMAGLYLVVEALDGNGVALARPIVDLERKERVVVKRWAEEVTEEVWQRIAADKQKDGVLDETVFARKRRGFMSEDVVIEDGRGRPLAQGRRVTKW
ncbi:MAG: hypothetical protein JNL12_21355 [Planctomycetes bacterium]|nr:hypothetical protein [Planctomycetota bacterium]